MSRNPVITGIILGDGSVAQYDYKSLANLPSLFYEEFKVGQVVVVNSIDEHGIPNGWKCVDMPKGGYYVPVFTQLNETTIKVDLKASDSSMTGLPSCFLTLPSFKDLPVGGDQLGGVKNGGNVIINADGTMTAPESSGSSGTSEAPVKSVNGKTGVVILSAYDVGALPSSYTPPNQTAAQVGADPAGTANNRVSSHNSDTGAHNDIRALISSLTSRLNTLANSTDEDLDQMAELVAYVKSNKGLIDSITTSKVSVSDIVDNLTSNVTDKPLSAAQGVAIKALIDSISSSLSNYQTKGDYALISAVPTKLSQLQNDSGYLNSYTETDPTVPAWAKQANKPTYTASEVGALPSGTKIPSKTSDLTNDSDFLTSSKLQEAINSALEQARISGNFDGQDGKTPLKGVDYFTPSDQEEIVQQVITALGTPVFGRVDGGNNVILSGNLPEGSYTLKYEDADGNLVDIGTIELGGGVTNMIPLSIGSDKALYNDGQGWKTGYRLNSSGAEASSDGIEVTGFIPFHLGDTIYMDGVTMIAGNSAPKVSAQYIGVYDSDFVKISSEKLNDGMLASSMTTFNLDTSNNLKSFKLDSGYFKYYGIGDSVSAGTLYYFRISAEEINNSSIITVNEPIE